MTQLATICNACSKEFDATKHVTERQLADRPMVTEYLLICPHCQAEEHSYFMDNTLRRLQMELQETTAAYQKNRTPERWEKVKRRRAKYREVFEKLNPPKVTEDAV